MPPPRLCVVGGEGQDAGYPPVRRGWGGRRLCSAQGCGRMDGKGFPINRGVDGWRDFPVNGRKAGWGVGPSFSPPPPLPCLWPGTAAGVSPLHGVELWGSPSRGHSLPVPTVLAPGRTVLALGSLPGMVFLGEVPAGKGRSLNRWGRPTAFLEGSSGDSPMWPPPKWAPTFLSGHSKPRRAAPSTATGPHLRGTGQENLVGGTLG